MLGAVRAGSCGLKAVWIAVCSLAPLAFLCLRGPGSLVFPAGRERVSVPAPRARAAAQGSGSPAAEAGLPTNSLHPAEPGAAVASPARTSRVPILVGALLGPVFPAGPPAQPLLRLRIQGF